MVGGATTEETAESRKVGAAYRRCTTEQSDCLMEERQEMLSKYYNWGYQSRVR
jgi:hypothetical protein